MAAEASRRMPDYVSLLRELERTKHLVDATARVRLTAEEATRIRALGFSTASAGWWDVPPVPPALVLGNQLFEHLACFWPAERGWSGETAPGTNTDTVAVAGSNRPQPQSAAPQAP